MPQRNIMSMGRAAFTLLAVLALGGCSLASVYDSPDEDALKSMSFNDARDTVKRTITRHYIALDYGESHFSGRRSGQGGKIKAVIITQDQLDLVTDNKPLHFPLSALAPKLEADDVWMDQKWAVLTIPNAGIDNAKNLLNALFFLKQAAPATPLTPDDVAFEKIAADYRGQATPPAIDPETERYSVQAADAVRDKHNDAAAELYCRALAVSPWWPQGHFNLALVLAEVGDYGWAADEMKRYLLLVPHAVNADEAQTKIYEWERRAGED